MRVESEDTAREERETVVPAARTRPRLGRGTAGALALGLAAAIVTFDQLTKAAITERYGPCGNPTFYPVFGDHAGFSYVCNTGTAFSMFQGTPFVWLPVGIAIGALCWLWFRSLATPQLLQQVAFGFVIGGAIGNVIDRARFGYVVDFVDLRITDTVRWYVFNVADASICIGVALLAVAFWRTPVGSKQEAERTRASE